MKPCQVEPFRASDLAGPGQVVKYTMPGPMTLVDGMVNCYYESTAQLHEDLVAAVREEIGALVEHGCKSVVHRQFWICK